jgi:hypothetical protein
MRPGWDSKSTRAHYGGGNKTRGRDEKKDVLCEAGRAKYSVVALRGSLSRTVFVESDDLRQRGLVDNWCGRELGPGYVRQFLDLAFPGHGWRCKNCRHQSGCVQILNCGDAGDGVRQGVRRGRYGECGTKKQEGNRSFLTICTRMK